MCVCVYQNHHQHQHLSTTIIIMMVNRHHQHNSWHHQNHHHQHHHRHHHHYQDADDDRFRNTLCSSHVSKGVLASSCGESATDLNKIEHLDLHTSDRTSRSPGGRTGIASDRTLRSIEKIIRETFHASKFKVFDRVFREPGQERDQLRLRLQERIGSLIHGLLVGSRGCPRLSPGIPGMIGGIRPKITDSRGRLRLGTGIDHDRRPFWFRCRSSGSSCWQPGRIFPAQASDDFGHGEQAASPKGSHDKSGSNRGGDRTPCTGE